MKHSDMHARDLFMVTFRYHLVRSTVWIRVDFKLSFEVHFHYILLLSVLHKKEEPLNVKRYSVVKFMVYF
jgi:hypothetical protein